jgi:translation initiation factor 1
MKNSRLVYSTNPSVNTNETNEPSSKDNKNHGTAKILLDRKGRKGKNMTIVEGLSVNPQHLAEIAKSLKQGLGTGGTAKQGRIEIQGDFRKKVAEKLMEMGIKSKFSGG